MYTREIPSGEIETYLEWTRSDTAQEIVEQLGFVPISKE
jgi:ABC-type phosphate transport system substrate-binding protein